MELRVQSVERTFDILEQLSLEQNGLKLTDLATRIDLPRSTVFRLLSVLRQRGYIEKEEGTNAYRLGLGFIELCSLYLNNLELKTEAAPHIRKLSAQTGNTVFLAIRQGAEVVYIDKAEQYNSIRKFHIIGQRRSLYSTSLGKSLVFDLPDREIRELLQNMPFEKFGPRTHESIESLLSDIEVSRERGWSLDDEEAEVGIRCMSSPIRDYRGTIIAAVSTSFRIPEIPADRYPEIAELVRDTALGISHRMGYTERTARNGTAGRPEDDR